MTWQAVLVDDERLARSELRELLRSHTEVAVVGEASDVAGAAERVRLTGANLLFLDIQLRGESGFDLLPRLPEDVAVVFVTAFDEYAVQAFKVHAVDYLLKPVAPERLAEMLRHLNQRGSRLASMTPEGDEGDALSRRRERLAWTARLFLRLDDRMGFLAVSQIRAVLADGDHAVIHTLDGRSVQVRKPLREWVMRLPDEHFLQIHRGTLVNVNEVQRVDEWSHGSFQVYLRGMTTPLVMSRRFAAQVRSRLG